MNSVLMTPAEFAAHRGVQKSAVSNWKRKNLLVFAEGDAGKLKIDVARTEAKLNAKLDPARGRPTTAQASAASEPGQAQLPIAPAPAPADNGLTNVRTDLLRHQVTAKALENARRAGDLVPLAEFERLAMENGRVARERMIALVRTYSERLAAERDPRLILAFMTDEIEKAFAELAESSLTGGEADDADALDAIEQAEDAIEAGEA